MLSTAFGGEGLGNPRNGFSSRPDPEFSDNTANSFPANINSGAIHNFLQSRLNLGSCILVATGIENHDHFVQLASESIGNTFDGFGTPGYQRDPAKYKGGDFYCKLQEHPATNYSIVFESCPWSHPSCYAYFVMNQLIGVASAFSSGGPGKGMYCRAI